MVNDSLLFVRRDPPVPPPPPPPLPPLVCRGVLSTTAMVLHVSGTLLGVPSMPPPKCDIKGVLCTANLSPRAMPPFFEGGKGVCKGCWENACVNCRGLMPPFREAPITVPFVVFANLFLETVFKPPIMAFCCMYTFPLLAPCLLLVCKRDASF